MPVAPAVKLAISVRKVATENDDDELSLAVRRPGPRVCCRPAVQMMASGSTYTIQSRGRVGARAARGQRMACSVATPARCSFWTPAGLAILSHAARLRQRRRRARGQLLTRYRDRDRTVWSLAVVRVACGPTEGQVPRSDARLLACSRLLAIARLCARPSVLALALPRIFIVGQMQYSRTAVQQMNRADCDLSYGELLEISQSAKRYFTQA